MERLSRRHASGLKDHGSVREGVYAATSYEGVEAHDARLKQERERLMPLVYCGACRHTPGITARAERADTQVRQPLEKALYRNVVFRRRTAPQ